MRQVHKVAIVVLLLALLTSGITPHLSNGVAYAAGSQMGTAATDPFTAVGVLQFERRQQVVLGASGIIQEVAVRVGDQVKQGDLLLRLDATQLDWTVRRAELNLQSAQLALKALQAKQSSGPGAVALAEANLLVAQEKLVQVKAGPPKEQLAAAQSRAAAAWAAYTELKQGPSQARLDVLNANLEKARVNLQQAQRVYDNVKWQPDIGASDQAAALQRATIDFQAAQGDFTATTTVSPATLAAALSSAQDAQFALDSLRENPTTADVAIAGANVAGAEAALVQAQQSPEIDIQLATGQVEWATIDLAEAKLAQMHAQVTAPVDGTVLAVLVDKGALGSAGSPVVTLADAKDLKLVVDIEQKDIGRVQIGQNADVSVFAVPDHPMKGTVEAIAPESIVQAGVTTFPVIIRLEGDAMTIYRAGMTANVTFLPK